MADLEIDFETELAAKYELIPATADTISKYRENSNSLLREIPENQWPFYLGSIVPIGKTKSQHLSAEKLGSAVRTLVAGLAGKTEPFHVIALKVVHDLGLHVPESPPQAWHWLANSLRFMFEGRSFWAGKEYKWPHPVTQQVGQLGIYLIPDKDNKPVLALRPEDLFDALTLVAARMIATGTTTFICENCKTPFLSGGSRGRNKRRGDARFCSDRCRYEFHNHRKAR